MATEMRQARRRMHCDGSDDLIEAAAGCTGHIQPGEDYRVVEGSGPGGSTRYTCRRCIDFEADLEMAALKAAGAPAHGPAAVKVRVARKRAARRARLELALAERGWCPGNTIGEWIHVDGRKLGGVGA